MTSQNKHAVQATPLYRTNDPFTFKINNFKLPSDLVADIVNKRYPACLAVLIIGASTLHSGV